MLFIKAIIVLPVVLLFELILTDNVWAWGPAIHTVIAFNILNDLKSIMPVFADAIRTFPLEYLYGSLSADFFVGKGVKKKNGHSHNWESGQTFLSDAKTEQEVSYACGFLSHLSADIAAHNYFVPNCINKAFLLKKAGHLYFEANADYQIGHPYIRIARDVLGMKHLECDDLLISAVGKGKNSLKPRRLLFTQSVKISDFLSVPNRSFIVKMGFNNYQISPQYLVFMINLSYRLAKSFLTDLSSSPCLSFDPIGTENLKQAKRKAIISRIFKLKRPSNHFKVDRKLLKI